MILRNKNLKSCGSLSSLPGSCFFPQHHHSADTPASLPVPLILRELGDPCQWSLGSCDLHCLPARASVTNYHRFDLRQQELVFSQV